MAEVAEDHPQLVAELDASVEAALGAVNALIARADDARGVALSTPGMERVQNVWGHDPRLYEWKQALEAMLEAEVVAPCFSPIGDARLEQFGG